MTKNIEIIISPFAYAPRKELLQRARQVAAYFQKNYQPAIRFPSTKENFDTPTDAYRLLLTQKGTKDMLEGLPKYQSVTHAVFLESSQKNLEETLTRFEFDLQNNPAATVQELHQNKLERYKSV